MRSLMLPVVLSVLTVCWEPAPVAGQTHRSDDPILRAAWIEGMERSQTERLAQILTDFIGPRLSGSPGFIEAVDWLEETYTEWGIDVRREQYGTWRGWRQGIVHVDLMEPRIQTLEAKLLAWSPGTDGTVEGEVVAVPALTSETEARDWLATVSGKVVLASAPEITCREPQRLRELTREETLGRLSEQREAVQQSWRERLQALGGSQGAHRAIEDAGAIAVLTSRWSEGWGVNKIFGSSTEHAVSIDLSCEDNGLLHRLATNGQRPVVRIEAEAEDLGTMPMFNVLAEIPGTALPDEYVMLSAHLDSWHGATGPTDNATGTITMLEAMRILKEVYPSPRRTILVGHWGGEEQGLIGSRAFTEDHPEVVQNLQVLFNQDNGTWRIEYIQAQGLSQAGGHLARWLSEIPTEISENIELDVPGPQETGGSDHVSFLCHGAPGFRLQSHYPDYRQYTWHTNRDTYDKIIFDDLKNNATLAAMLMYLASEDPERLPRDRSVLPPNPRTGQEREWIPCRPARRSYN
jgi:carboxypeptidase Q